MSSNRSLQLIFRKLEKSKFNGSEILDLLQEIEVNIESIEDQQNNELIVKMLTFLITHENLLVRKNSDFFIE
jgi:hypothetical protein